MMAVALNEARVVLSPSSTKMQDTKCQQCGKKLPHHGGVCPETRRKWYVKIGKDYIEQQWPGYSELLNETMLAKAGRARNRTRNLLNVSGFPKPSELFPGLDPAVDNYLVREKRDKDITLCRIISSIPVHEQREFLNLYLIDVIDAQHWLNLPNWKRPLRKGDIEDQQIWKFFTMQRLCMERASSTSPWSLASQGAQLPQMFGVLDHLSVNGLKKLVLVMSMFGSALQNGNNIGDLVTPPWVK